MTRGWIYYFGVGLSLLARLATAGMAESRPVREPLPIDIALSIKGHANRSTVAFSPNGRWIAHTVETTDDVPPGSRFFAATGTSLAEGHARMEAHLTNTHTGEEVRLGGPKSSSWAPTWSPDGTRVAFYSDQGGLAGLWIWDEASRRATPFPGVVVRPFFGFEWPRWSADSQTLLCKVLSEGMTVAEANALNPLPQVRRQFPAHDDITPSVLVLKSSSDAVTTNASEARAFTNRSLADLALIDLRVGTVQRIARASKIVWYGFSPDQQAVAFTFLDGEAPVSQDLLYGIKLFDRRSGGTRSLARHLPMDYGTELNWSPGGRSLALITHDEKGAASLSLLPADGSPLSRVGPPSTAALMEKAPHWTADGKFIYATAAGGRLWRVETASGAARAIEAPAGFELSAPIAKFDQAAALETSQGSSLWAVGFQRDRHRFSLLRISSRTGRVEVEASLPGEVQAGSNVVASNAGHIAFVIGDEGHPADLWVYEQDGRHLRQVSRINPELDRYELGAAKLISYRAADGRELHASLLLPPGFHAGRPLPTVLWVYGGENGSEAVHTFGLLGTTPVFDMHVLATRGYAVLFPDAPVGEGTAIRDLLATVLPAVDAAVAQGYSDPARLAIMGQSFGAYSVLALISHTNRFKAAVATASVINPDLLASYLEMDDDGSPRWIGYFEHGQGGMGGSPWEQPARYQMNSPVFAFDKITTPLLLAQGADDGRLAGSDAAFIALRRLGKDVEYRIYEGEGHVLQQRSNVRDFWLRRLAFLDEHLVGGASQSSPQ